MFKQIVATFAFAAIVAAAPADHATSYASVHHHETHSVPIKVHGHAPAAIVETAHHHEEKYPDAHPKYEFKYGVEDKHTGDIKNQQESRDGDVVKGEYSLAQPDGTVRKVEYSSDHHTGFNADVSYSGHAVHPKEVKKVVVPVHHH